MENLKLCLPQVVGTHATFLRVTLVGFAVVNRCGKLVRVPNALEIQIPCTTTLHSGSKTWNKCERKQFANPHFATHRSQGWEGLPSAASVLRGLFCF